MRMLSVALLLIPLTAGSAAAQAGDAEAGKAFWEGGATRCRQCHGVTGEGGFGPDLAGRPLTVSQFTRAVRNPWGVMPAFIESQVTGQEILDLIAYFDALPTREEPGAWRIELPPGAPGGQVVAGASVGCLQCHGLEMNGPRDDMGAVDASFEWFKGMVYNHTAEMPRHWELLDETPAVRVRMGNYSPSRLPESALREIYDWVRDLGLRVKMAGRLSAGATGPTGVTYTLNVENIGLPEKGLTAEDVTVSLVVPAGASVVSTTGDGYRGVSLDEQAKANVAVWQLPSLAVTDQQTYTLTLSQAGTAEDNVRGSIRWTSPALQSGQSDAANIAPAPIASVR